ncbi:MAG: methylene-tetrahydromethanopterin dehydrogenase N-terminal domain-containing protein [Candidatus Altiarchaeota archaeon]|nr:methylene-tetrahydromethanopterin dehydrogenase N-terminal domain-containing protein [Candidatus Altiarchaeota archaeon]
MKKILAYISPEKYASLFDLIVAYDAGADVVVPYCNIDLDDMRDMVHSCVFTRHPNDLKDTAIFIGGHDVDKGEELMNKAVESFNELPDAFRVSIVADPDGAYTTSSACVVKIKNSCEGNLSGLNATILAGTGPVGQRIAVLLAKEGCNVTLTSRKLDRSESSCRAIKEKYGVDISPFEARDDESTEEAVSNSDVVVATGPEGVVILPKSIWSKFPGIRVMADVNAVPPYGIEGVDARDDKEVDKEKMGVGALAIGNLKIKCHHEIVKELFKEKKSVLDLEEVYKIAESII